MGQDPTLVEPLVLMAVAVVAALMVGVAQPVEMAATVEIWVLEEVAAVGMLVLVLAVGSAVTERLGIYI